MTFQEILLVAQPFIQTIPQLAKYAPAIDALIELLESGYSQDDAVALLKSQILSDADKEMAKELGQGS